MSTDYELFKAFLDQAGVGYDTFEGGAALSNTRGFALCGEDRKAKVDGWGVLEVAFRPDGSLVDLFFHEDDPGKANRPLSQDEVDEYRRWKASQR